MRDFFSCLFVIIGAIIGAGFASGREILNFFNIYEKDGLIGICTASAFFGFVIISLMFIIKKRKVENYRQLVNNKYLEIILQVFSLVCFCVMISSIGAFFKQQFNMNFWLGSAISSAVCYLMFLNDFKGIKIINCILVPLIVLGIIFLGISNYEGINIDVPDLNVSYINYTANWFISAILYASYNSLILIPILINFRDYKLSNKRIFALGITTFIILSTLMILIYRTNSIFYPEILNVELPNMMLASLLSNKIKAFYCLVLLASIFTTAFSCGYSFLNMRNKDNYERNAFLLCAMAFACSGIGFSNMINICFPFFGYIGVFQILSILRSKTGVNKK